MKTPLALSAFILFAHISLASTIIVDINGGGQFRSIQGGIDAASANDTVKVWPGTYFEQVTLNKNITLMGSGYETTIITGSNNPTITVSSGRLQWFQITSLTGVGISLSGGTVRNCVIRGSASHGIYSTSGSSSVLNCVLVNNGGNGISACSNGTISVTNCISWSNTGYGFTDGNYFAGCGGLLNLSYSDGSSSGTSGKQGCINQDPLFSSADDFHIADNGPCSNTGNPSLADPDGSRSDMGYFGGPDCPIYPVVLQIIISPSGNTIDLSAKARANY
jgi:hypothetical protein